MLGLPGVSRRDSKFSTTYDKSINGPKSETKEGDQDEEET